MPIPRKRPSVAIDTVPLPERIARGKITKVGTKFFLTVAGKKREIPIGLLSKETDLRPLVGKRVAVAFSKKSPGSIVAIGPWPEPEISLRPPKFRITCYIPAPDIIRQLHESVRYAVIRDLMKGKFLSKELGGQLMR